MQSELTRRGFLGAAVAGSAGLAVAAEGPQGFKILAICGSPKKPSSTAQALQVCLEAAQAVDPRITVELVELAGLELQGDVAAGVELPEGARDDFPGLLPKLTDPALGGLIIGSPVYFGNMTARLKAFLDRCGALRKEAVWSNKTAGVVAVGGSQNGGQDLVIQSVQAVLLCHEMLVVGDGRPISHRGATVWNNAERGGVAGDEYGLQGCRGLGRRVAQVALEMAGLA
jgi:multimeric flavodoxin WrbA